MKKLISIFLIFNLLLLPLAAETIKIETSKGETDLVIPETQEELREAFIEMSKLYVEERYAYEALLKSSEEATSEMNKYIESNKLLRDQYNQLTEDYSALVDTMNKRTKAAPVRGLVGIELGFEDQFKTMVPAVDLGIYIFEKVLVKTRIAYPWTLGIGIGYTF